MVDRLVGNCAARADGPNHKFVPGSTKRSQVEGISDEPVPVKRQSFRMLPSDARRRANVSIDSFAVV